jgi:membrane protein DedA with SNARE-associated domain
MIFELLNWIVESILLLVESSGYAGIFVGMVIESSFIPFPSEVILIPAGALISQGEFSFFLVLIVSILGSIIGALINYALALFIGRNAINLLVSKYGKFFFITKKGLDKSEKLFNKYGNISTLIGRLIPGVRQLISLPAGFFRMKLTPFIALTAIGSGIWTCILLSIGYYFNEIPMEVWEQNSFILYIISFLICLIILVGYLIIRQKKKQDGCYLS